MPCQQITPGAHPLPATLEPQANLLDPPAFMIVRAQSNAGAGPSTPRRRLVEQQSPHLGSPGSENFPRLSLSPSSLGPSPFASTFSSPSVFSSANASVDYFSTPSGEDLSHSTVASSIPPASPARLAGRTIESVSVPHFSKSGKQWLFACRVVPAASARALGGGQRQKLGKMSPAGDSEPHTVWRSWQDFLDFAAECVPSTLRTRLRIRADPVYANSLLLAFPDERAISAPSVPRLASRTTLFTTRTTLVRRQEDLDLFCRQLFSLPPDVKESTLVQKFFQLGLEDRLGALSLRENLLTRPVLPKFASVDDANGLALKPPRSLRPTLAIKTSSPDLRTAINEFDDGPRSCAPSPLAWTEADATRTALLFQREQGLRTEDGNLRPTLRSTSNSIQAPALSSRSNPLLDTAVPSRAAEPASSVSLAKTLRKKASGHLKHFRSLGDLRGAGKKSLPPIPTESVPALPAPFAFPQSSQPPAMIRAHTELVVSKSAALPPTPTEAAHRPAALSATLAAGMGRVPSAPTSAPLPGRHRRTGSIMSTTSSIEDLWGSPFPQFRQTPSGRVEYVRPEELARSAAESRRQSASFASAQPQRVPSTGSRGRVRPAMPRPGRHVSSASISSIDSARSSISSASGRSLAISLSRSSGGGSDGYTPPTPQMEWTTSLESGAGDVRQQALVGKYSVERGVCYESNMVPPPPFFVSAATLSLTATGGSLQLTRFDTQPVPPPMGSARFNQRTPRTSDTSLGHLMHESSAFLHDKTPATPRSRSASGASISSSCRRFSNTGPFALADGPYSALESIPDSPAQSSAASTPRMIDGASSHWTFKFLHRDENVVLRVPRPDEPDQYCAPILSDLRGDIRSKFRACGVNLPADGGEAEWGLAWTPRGQPGAVRLVVSQADLDACIADFVDGPGRGKLVMKIIC